MRYWGGSISAPGIFFFFYHSPPVPIFAAPQQTIRRTFLQCLRMWPILCTQFMTMARVVVLYSVPAAVCWSGVQCHLQSHEGRQIVCASI